MTNYTHDSTEASSISCSAGTTHVRPGQTATLSNTENGWTKTGTASGSLYEQGNAAPDGSRWVQYGDVSGGKTQIDLARGDSVTVTVSAATTNGANGH
jgi:hypothetical protein